MVSPSMKNFTRLGQAKYCEPRNTLLANPFSIQGMERDSDLDILARNLRLLLDRTGYSNKELARRSGVADGTIGGILRRAHMPGIDKVARIAKTFGLSTYHLLMPDFDPDLLRAGKFDYLYKAYRETTDDGRRVLEANADYITRGSKGGSNDPNNRENSKGSAG